jgi:hypothetical protein
MEFEVVIMIAAWIEEMHGSERVPGLNPNCERALVGSALLQLERNGALRRMHVEVCVRMTNVSEMSLAKQAGRNKVGPHDESLSGRHKRGIDGIINRALELLPSACHVPVSPAATRQKNWRLQGWIVER